MRAEFVKVFGVKENGDVRCTSRFPNGVSMNTFGAVAFNGASNPAARVGSSFLEFECSPFH